ncbi:MULTISPECIES: MMPL family transporter [Pseudomonas]|uniref:MMPL family transporter n=1 Tax=Pseudomonas mandelii TaxID=75612 RepID=A0AB36CY26_9PSED|nr:MULTISPECIES: MMPL family transporter [Pseudomonas]MBU0525622.1 MMPL family transporter [Gammaproteobacteria bacterium]MDF9883520.1 putative exporter [Pseudomonas silensiensis]MBU0818218.1 MMPL family transporter [Gammaproteobacteria bacterium]MBU0840028.1 MMPL family transporter [Gammaproteobacteria bacterium]MBU1840808.1 MMPL family transporter [Gammaproteobacteria bacterium]
MTLPSERRLPWLFLILLLAVLALAGWQWRDGAPLSANLMELVPGTAPDALELRAEQRIQEPLNREMLVLVGHKDRPQAIAMAQKLGEQWQASGLFEKVQWNLQADLPALRTQLLQGRLSMLSAMDRQQLIEHPDAFIQQRVQALFDPFTGFSLVPSQDDWLGLTGRIQNSQPQHGAVQLDIGSGALVADADGKSWVLLRAKTTGNAFDMSLPLQVADLLERSRKEAAQADVQLLAASGLLYAANGQQQATREMTWVGGGATVGILLLLLLAFRRWRVLLAFVPVLVGMLFGAVACVALFGHMHVMTLVLGSSLIGVAVDYPLHYLSKSWSLKPWNSWPALRLTLPGLTLSLITSCIGYLALAWTPFPALTQIAVFSAAGLLGAYLSAVCLLPALLKGVNLRPAHWPLRICECLLNLREALLKHVSTPVLLALLIAFCVGGLLQLESKNDIRQWIGAPQQLTDEAQAIARITGYQPTSQFFLVRAANQQELLERQTALSERLDQLVNLEKLQGYLSLNQLVSQPSEQHKVREALSKLPQFWQPLLDLGVPAEALQAELATLLALPAEDIDASLVGPLAEPYRTLWLGPTDEGVAAMVSLQGLNNPSLLRIQALDLPGVELVDRLGELNSVFAATQISAAQLKLASCVLIVLVLILPFGFGGALRIVSLPLLAALCSLASLGWMGQPLTLFSLFGLLLVTAISVDYAILMREQVGGAAVSLLGTLLAAVTTWLSFGLLAVSSTPAVSNFGLSVSLGLAFSFILAPWAGRQVHAAAVVEPAA